jgi:signal peptidase I
MRAPCTDIVPLVRDALQQGGRARLTVTGVSMRPFIRSGDVVELASVTAPTLTLGVVVLVETPEGQYLLHRVTRKTADGLFTRGDANVHEEGPFNPNSIVARVTGVVRGDCVVPLDTGTSGLLARVWNASRACLWLMGAYDCSHRAAGRVLRRLGLRSPLPPPL